MGKANQNKGSLASGSVRRWSKSQPKLLANTQDNSENIKTISFTQKITLGLRFIIVIITVATISFLGAVALLGTTILPVLKIDGHHWLIQRSVYTQGQVPLNSVVLSLGKPLERTTLSRLTLLFKGASTSSIVKIVALPLDKISIGKSKQVFINGNLIKSKYGSLTQNHTLGDQYLAICLSGDCGAKYGLVEIPTNYILGKILGEIRFGIGLGLPPSDKGDHNV